MDMLYTYDSSKKRNKCIDCAMINISDIVYVHLFCSNAFTVAITVRGLDGIVTSYCYSIIVQKSRIIWNKSQLVL